LPSPDIPDEYAPISESVVTSVPNPLEVLGLFKPAQQSEYRVTVEDALEARKVLKPESLHKQTIKNVNYVVSDASLGIESSDKKPRDQATKRRK